MMKIEIHNEDCRETLSRMPEQSVNLLLQDTPFGVTKNKWDKKPNLQEMWPIWERVAAPNAAFLFFATQPFAAELIYSNASIFRYDLIWYKPLGSGFLNSGKMPMRNHESILVFYKELPTYNPQKGIGIRKKGKGRNDRTNSNYGILGKSEYYSYDDAGTRHPQSVMEFTNGDRTKEAFHPTQKPIDLIRYLVRTYTNEGDTVFDGYAGSGTTPAACFLENRHCVASELEKRYYDYSIERVAKMKAMPPLFDCIKKNDVIQANFLDLTDSK